MNKLKTRMHSIRMRTDRGSSHLGGGGWVYLPGGGGVCPPGVGGCLARRAEPPPPGQIDACENIYFPHTTYAVGNKQSSYLSYTSVKRHLRVSLKSIRSRFRIFSTTSLVMRETSKPASWPKSKQCFRSSVS